MAMYRLTTYERLLKSGWVNVDGENPSGDQWNNGHCYVFTMHNPERNVYHSRVEATNINDTCFECIRPILQEAIDAAKEFINRKP